jgi:hypothetical protein
MTRLKSAIASVLAVMALLGAPPAHAAADPALEAQDDWVEGNLMFLAYHEVGHLLLDQVLRVNQNADRLAAGMRADDTATWLLSPEPGDDDDSAEIIAALGGWLIAAFNEDPRTPDADLYPKADMRAARIACLPLRSVDAKPNPLEDLTEIAELHFDVAACPKDYRALDAEMEAALGGLASTRGGSKARATIVYDQPPEHLEEAADFLKKSEVLEDMKKDLEAYVGRPISVTPRGAACGANSPGFQYLPSRKEITACYEEVDWFLYGDIDAGAATPNRKDNDALGARPRRIAPLQAQVRPSVTPPPR